MNDTPIEEAPTKFTTMNKRELGKVLLLGAVAGLAIWGISVLADKYIFQALLCQNDALRCDMTSQYSMIGAMVVVGVLALLGLIRLAVFRPLLVVLAVMVSLWSLTEVLWTTEWYYAALGSVLLYALAYATFSWIARILNFWIALIICVILVVAIRFVITS